MADLPIAPSFSGPLKNGRLLVLGFEENSDRIQINTDFRTRKIEELNHCPFAEICWYFSDSWEHSGSMEELKLSMGPIPIRKSFRLQVLLPFQQRKKDHLSVHGITLL
ncbi:PYRIDOXINE-5-PHOSPHATE OXIDASE [Salix koriyanagi]|uniref:PYRIDOXINE-5-PHOSPHATE OXIDASE n=1 Tax=Salix koriyanagi TaxID=2511006 RepID=A0A9Q0TER7_9ROSI|nr:PYRIDOXINE-5-PHOSPHATE OXIDASE [Salix koriyanagi]